MELQMCIFEGEATLAWWPGPGAFTLEGVRGWCRKAPGALIHSPGGRKELQEVPLGLPAFTQ